MSALTQNTPEWEAWRGQGIGASEVWTAYRNPLALYLSKREGIRSDPPDPEFAAWGHDVEAAILANIARRYGWALSGPVCLTHPEKPWHRASLDGMAGYGSLATWPASEHQWFELPQIIIGPVDAKNRAFGWRDFGDDGELAEAGTCPPDLRVQIMAQCYVASAALGVEITRGWVAVSVGGQPPRALEVPYDRDLYEGEIVPAVDEAWQRILDGNPPEPRDSAGASALYPRATDDDPVRLTGDEDAMALSYVEAKAAEKRASEEADAIKARLCASLAGHSKAVGERVKISWSNVAGRESLDAKLLREKRPEIYEQFVRVGSGHRMFRVTPMKAKEGSK